MTTAQIIDLIQQHDAQIDHVKLLQILQKQINKAKLQYSATDVYHHLKKQGLSVTHCQGHWGAAAVNNAAVKLGLLAKGVCNGFPKGYVVTEKGRQYGLKIATGYSVKYTQESMTIIKNFFQSNKHLLHNFVVQ